MVALLTCLLISASTAAAEPAAPPSRTLSILKGPTHVPPRSYSAWRVSTEDRKGGSSLVVGRLRAEGGRDDRVALAVLTEADFAGWRRGYAAAPLYLSGEVASANVRAPLPRPGVYYVVISNLFSATAPKTVNGTLDLVWSPAPASASEAGASASLAPRDVYRRDLLSFCAVLVLAGILALWSIQRPEPIPSEKKIA
jgi:hypothetical protein